MKNKIESYLLKDSIFILNDMNQKINADNVSA